MLSTKNLPTSSGMSKTILPGERTIKINEIQLTTLPYDADAYHVTLICETQPIEGFEGFYIDKDNQSKGRYLGQIGTIRAGYYPFKDGVTNSGIVIKRDRSILQFIKNLSNELGFADWFTDQDNKFNTIEDFITNMNKEKPFKGIYFNAVVCGKGYDKAGYINYNLYLPRFTKTEKPIENLSKVETASEANMITFDPNVHIKMPATSGSTSESSISSFDVDETPVSNTTSKTFSFDE